MRTLCLFSLVAALTGLWAGCETDDHHLAPPKSTTVLNLEPSARDVLATLKVGSAIRILLPPPAEPGVQWVIIANPGRTLVQTTDLRPAPDAPEKFAVTFQAVRAMRSRLMFAAIKPGQAEADAAESFSVIVGVSETEPSGPGL
jgi:hypothetical protein